MNNHPVKLSKTELFAGFMMKVVLGLIYGWIFFHFYPSDDTWEIHRDSLRQTNILLNDPGRFFRGYLPLQVFEGANGVGQPLTQFIAEMEFALVTKTLAFFNLVSGGNYYVNSILLNAIVFFGHLWLFNTLNRMFPEKRRMLYLVIFFFIPAVFWVSGIRGDGLLFFFFAMMLYHLSSKRNGWPVVIALIGFGGVVIIRPEFGILLLVGVIAYLVSVKLRRHAVATFVVVYAVVALLFFGGLAFGYTGIADHIIFRQHLFLLLKGTAFHIDPLQPTVGSFMKALPQAINNSLLRPYLWEAHSALQVFYAVEVMLFAALVIVAFYYRHPDWKQRLSHPVILLILFFSASVYLFIGMVVPFPGAIVRYKSIPELALVCVLVVICDFSKVLNIKYIWYFRKERGQKPREIIK